MKTLIIVSHPDIDNSSSQQFLKESLPLTDQICWHHLETIYPTSTIDIDQERSLLKAYDRIIFQFPFYWYLPPFKLKQWLDEVLTEPLSLKGKELGLVLVVGSPAKDYQVGGKAGFTLSSLTSPYQAIAHKLQLKFLKLFPIFQFQYKSEEEKMRLLVAYQQYLTLPELDSLKEREQWFLAHLENEMNPLNAQLAEKIRENRLEIDELRMYLEEE